MLDIFLSIVLGCSGVCLAYYFLEVWGTPPEESRKIWTTIK